MQFETPRPLFEDDEIMSYRCITNTTVFYITEWNGDWGLSIHSKAPFNKSYEDMVALAESFEAWLEASNLKERFVANLDHDPRSEF